MKNAVSEIVLFSLIICSCSARSQSGKQSVSEASVIAFPGAEGFGKYTTGGRGGKVYVVTNLDDDGAGSFRDAVEAKEARIIVFAISGTIHLQSRLAIKSDVTIAGQTAPGDGICLADYPVSLGGDNIIVRYMRFRMGDKNQRGGMVNGNGGDDTFGGTRRKNIIVDHCSMSWSTDEVCSIYAGDSTTVQWNMIYEPLNYSYHFETGDKDYEQHGYGGIWGGKHSTFHHNLIAHCNSRTPRFDGIRNTPEENCDLVNNVIYDWGHNNVYAGEGGTYNIINNYYKPGPNTKKGVRERIVNPWNKPPKIEFGKYYVDGNYVEGSNEVTNNNWNGVDVEKGAAEDKEKMKLSSPFPAVEISIQSAKEAYNSVLQNAGAVLPQRDTLDQRIIRDVKKGTGKFVDVQGGYPHGTAYEETINAWPALRSLPAPKDIDSDGMPDTWEKKHGLNATDPSDARGTDLDRHYTNIEVYINSITKNDN